MYRTTLHQDLTPRPCLASEFGPRISSRCAAAPSQRIGSRISALGFLGLLSPVLLLAVTLAAAAQTNNMNHSTHHLEVATLGGGCFWCTEAVFQMLPGVKSVTSGYAGGTKANPTYKEVCAGDTGHAEVIQVQFDPSVISYEKLLATFWDAHDPTTLNRQGADAGPQYRSIILYSSEAQKADAEKSRAEAQKQFRQPIVTEIVPLTKFYPAEDYHQDYYRDNPNQPYCRIVIRPKVEKFEQKLKAGKH
jgi:peptide-methionine (S)-S-oxide reductase